MCLQAWVAARDASDFKKFAPVLSEWINLNKERCKCIDKGRPTYDVALQDFEKGMTTARLDAVFSEVGFGACRQVLQPLGNPFACLDSLRASIRRFR